MYNISQKSEAKGEEIIMLLGRICDQGFLNDSECKALKVKFPESYETVLALSKLINSENQPKTLTPELKIRIKKYVRNFELFLDDLYDTCYPSGPKTNMSNNLKRRLLSLK